MCHLLLIHRCSNTSWGDISNGRWELPAALLSNDKLHTFRVTVSKAVASDTRSASADISLTPRPAEIPIPTGKLQRLCGKASSNAASGAAASAGCPAKHNSDLPLSLLLKVDAGFEQAAVAWQSDQVNLSTTAGSTQLTLQPSQLQAAGSSITVVAVVSLGGQTGSTSMTVPLNSKPACRSSVQAMSSSNSLAANCMEVTELSNEYGNAAFIVSAQDYQDDSALR